LAQSHNVTLIRQDGVRYDFEELGITLTDLTMRTPEAELLYEQVADHMVDAGTTLKGRKLSASFFFSAADSLDFPLLVNDIFAMLSSKQAFYLVDGREPGKRMLVKAEGFEVTQHTPTNGEFSVTFASAGAYRESVSTTLGTFDFDSELWQIGQGLSVEDEQHDYTFSTSTFSVFNAGDVTVDPRYMPLTITFTGASTNLQIVNNTTGETWQYTGTTVAGNTIVLDGTKALKNGSSVFGATNRKVLTLAPGANSFTMTGASGTYSISFEFRYYYV